MIKTNIAKKYPHQIRNYKQVNQSIFVADYSQQTQSHKKVKVSTAEFTDIQSFELKNEMKLPIGYIIFNNSSFTNSKGTLPQCECVALPDLSDENSWMLFLELKYCQSTNNVVNLKNAILKLYKTRTYYYQAGIFQKTNKCYLLASLPAQTEPFLNFSIPPIKLVTLKSKHNVILRLQNSAEIADNEIINV